MSIRRTVSGAAVAALLSAPVIALPVHSFAATAPAPTAGLWAVDSTANSLTEYASSAHGSANPLATIEGSDTGLSAPSAVAVNDHGRIFVSNAGNNSITEYAAGASGNVAPIATIAGSKTGLAAPSSIVINRDQLWVTDPDDNVIEAFTVGTTGNELPAATFSGPKTKLDHPIAISIGDPYFAYVLNAPATGTPTVTAYFLLPSGNERPFLTYTPSKSHPLVRPTWVSPEIVEASVMPLPVGERRPHRRLVTSSRRSCADVERCRTRDTTRARSAALRPSS